MDSVQLKEEPIFQQIETFEDVPMVAYNDEYNQPEQFDEFDHNHCKTQSRFEDDTVQDESSNFFTDLGENYSILENEAKHSVVIVKTGDENFIIASPYITTRCAYMLRKDK